MTSWAERWTPERRRVVREILLVAAVVGLVVVVGPRMCRGNLLPAGSPAPALDLAPALDPAHPVTRTTLEGRRAVVLFWTAWCSACKPMLPGLAALARDRPDVRFVAAHADAEVDPEVVRRYARSYPDLTITFDGERFARSWKVGSFPTTYVLAADGRICEGFSGRTSPDDVASALDACAPAQTPPPAAPSR